MALRVGIYLFDAVEVLDFAGPFEVFATAARLAARGDEDAADSGRVDGDGDRAPFEVVTIAAGAADRAGGAGDAGSGLAPIRARGGLAVVPQHRLADHPPLDVLIVPGGDVAAELARPGLDDWLVAQSCTVQVLASVCTGAFLLEQAGLLNEREVATHWEDADGLRRRSQESGSLVQVLANQRWVEAKPWVHHGGICRLFTSAGIAAGIDLALHLVAELQGVELARRTARQMDYDWRAANGAVIHAARG